jgi:hypothetical protein
LFQKDNIYGILWARSTGGFVMFKHIRLEVEGREYDVCFDSRTLKPLAVDRMADNGDWWQVWANNRSEPGKKIAGVIELARTKLGA